MDPNECLKRWRDAYVAGNQRNEALHAQEDLVEWLNAGGFWPSEMTEVEIECLRNYRGLKIQIKPPSDYIYG